MVLIKVNLGKHNNLADDDGILTVEAESERLFDVCNAFVDATQTTRDVSTSAIDTEVFGLVESGVIPQVPKLDPDEIEEFIQKIAFALSSPARLAVLCELHARPMMRATVAILEMVTGVAGQTLRRHLKVLLNCRLVKRTRVGQTFLYESTYMRLATLNYLWKKLVAEDD